MQPAIKMALRIARQGSEFLKAHFERQDPTSQGSDTHRDQLAQVESSIYASFFDQLQKAYKDHYIAPAGDVDANGAEKSWHIFPLLGDDNFLRGIPEFAMAMVQKKQGRAEHMLLINPVTGEEYAASRGQGAALNSRRIRMNGVHQLGKAALVTNLLDHAREHQDDPQLWGEMTSTLANHAAQLRTSGCAILDIARVSAGHLDGLVLFRPDSLTQSLGMLMIQETGGLSGDFSGNPFKENSRQLAVANPKLFKELLRTLHPFRERLPRSS
jgi:myo-inositol-1(or 4)-monophosphatase